MRWGLRSKQHQQPQEQEQEVSKAGKRRTRRPTFSSFSPLAWLSKLTAKNNAAKLKNAEPTEAKNNAGGYFPISFFHKRATPSPASESSPADSSSPVPAAPDMAPRRRSVGSDDAEGAAAAVTARQLYRRRHFSVGGDGDLSPLNHLIRLSRAASPQRTLPPVSTPTPVAPLPSDTEEEKRPRSRQYSQYRRRSSARRSFSGRTPVVRVSAVRVRSPRCSAAAAVSGLERFAVVRRTRDPQREFRDSMVEMIASKRIGRPDELETLLACYLSLNADEHHDCIVKVFRQVWFELNPARAAVAAAVAAPPRN